MEWVKASGWEFMDYVPNNAYIVRFGAERSISSEQAKLVRWASDYHSGFKVSPDLSAANIARESLVIASAIDIYTNDCIVLEEL